MPGSDIFETVESNVQTYARSFPCVFERASGAELFDKDGRRYLDFLAGAGSLNYGHNNSIFKKALIEFIESDGITHSLDLHTCAKEQFLTAMQHLILEPRNLDYVIQFTGPTGTNAVEAALKLARKVTGRNNIICFTNGFHGVTAGALATTGNKHHRGGAGMALSGATFVPYDGYLGDDFDSIDYLSRVLNDNSSGIDLPAAVIVETVQGEGGLNAASIPWLKRLERLCKAHEILLIVDDIQAGCGRTGTFFSFEHAGIKPDIVTVSKSLSGFGLPIAIVLLKRRLDIWKPGEHNGTFRGNNHAFITATSMLHHFWHDNRFSDQVTEKGDHLAERLEVMFNCFQPHIKDVRGRGMMRGLSFNDPIVAARITEKAFENGLVIERSGPDDEVIKFLMPLTIEMSQLNEGLDILRDSIVDVIFDTKKIDNINHRSIMQSA